MISLNNTLLGAAMAAGVLALSAASASASVVCSGHVCWHSSTVYEYPSEAHVIVHPDTWRWRPDERFSWREHEGRGYWRDDRWIEW